MKNGRMRLGAILILIVMFLVWVLPAVAAEKTAFTCIETVSGAIPGDEIVLSSGNTHIRGTILLADEWATDPQLTGVNTIVLNANLRVDDTGPMWGTFRIENEDGGWEGTYAGHLKEWYNAVGEGFGAYEGAKM